MTAAPGERAVWHGRLAVSRGQVLAAVVGVVSAVVLTVLLHVLSHGGSVSTAGFLWFTAVVATLGIPARIRVEPAGLRILSWLGFPMRSIERSAIVSAEVVPVDAVSPDVAERDRYVRGDGAVLLLHLENGSTVALSPLAPEIARASIAAMPRADAPPFRTSRLLPRIAVDDREYRRHLTVLALLPAAIGVLGIAAVAAMPGPQVVQIVVILAVLTVLLAALGAAFASVGGAPVNLRARGSSDFDVRAKLTLGAVGLLLAPSGMFALVAGMVGWNLSGVASADDLSPAWLIPSLLGAAVLLPASWSILRRMPKGAEFDVSVPAMTLEPTERAIWIGRTPRDRRLTAIWVTLGLLPLGLAVVVWPVDRFVACVMVVPLVVAIGALVLAPRFVHIDEAGFRVVAANGIPRAFVPLAQIDGARVDQVTLGDEWWGSGRNRRRLITRAGEAIEVRRTARKPLVVTVDAAPEAVAVLRALLDRD